MSSSKQTLGILGEEMAFHELKKRGYKILIRNFECVLGEIDLIGKQNGQLVFIEVKTRSSDLFGLPAEAVTHEKQRQIVKVAQFYLKRYGIRETSCRFDVVSVLLWPGQNPQIDIFEGAFGENLC
jgi:putative endonuclease